MSITINRKKYLSMPEAAVRIGCTRQTMHRYVTSPKSRAKVEAIAGKMGAVKDTISGDCFVATTWITKLKSKMFKRVK